MEILPVSVVTMAENEVSNSLRDTALIIMSGFAGGVASQAVGKSIYAQLGVVGGLFLIMLPSIFAVYWITSRLGDKMAD